MVLGIGENKNLKFVVIGPLKTGKTTVVNYLADDSDNLGKDKQQYVPTLGLRIRECEKEFPPYGKIPVELWDCSGDQSYESCWPAIMADAHGVILIYNPEKAAQEQEITLWYEYFVKEAGLDDEQCLLFIHRPSSGVAPRVVPPPKLSRVQIVNTNFESGPLIKKAFEEFIFSLLSRKPINS